MSKDELDNLLDYLDKEDIKDVDQLVIELLDLVETKNKDAVNKMIHHIIEYSYVCGVEDGLSRGSYK